MKKFIKPNLDLALLLVRLGFGVAFLAHGIQKFQGIGGTMKFFGSLGIPGFMAYVVAAVETLGGLAMIVGLFTEIAGILLAAVMVVAIALVKLNKGLVGGYELELSFLLSSLAIVFAGPGKYALKLPSKKAPAAPAMTGPAPQA